MEVLVAGLFGWVIIGVAITPIWAAGDLETHDVVWWPIAVLKALLKTLYRVLFTGWRL